MMQVDAFRDICSLLFLWSRFADVGWMPGNISVSGDVLLQIIIPETQSLQRSVLALTGVSFLTSRFDID
jgi:hypothetical protein